MRILVTTHHLFDYAGSETYTLTLAEHLKRSGHEVIVYSCRVGRIASDFEAVGVAVCRGLDEICGERFDVIHAQHNVTAMEVRLAFPNVPLVFQSHGVLPFLEAPPPIDIGVRKYLCVSEEVRDHLRFKLAPRVPAEDVVLFRNVVDAVRFAPRAPIGARPARALVLSNKLSLEAEAALREAFARTGIEPLFAGARFLRVDYRHLPALMNEADIVVSLGRGAMEAMLCGRIPLVFDYAGGDGLVTPGNALEIARCNFSGRYHGLRLDAAGIESEIAKYKAWYGPALRTIAVDEFDAERRVPALVAVYREAIAGGSPPSLDDATLGLLHDFVQAGRETRAISDALWAGGWGRPPAERPDRARDPIESALALAGSLAAEKWFAAERFVLESAVAESPACLSARNRLALLATAEGRYHDALQILKGTLAIAPSDPEAAQVLDLLRVETAASMPAAES